MLMLEVQQYLQQKLQREIILHEIILTCLLSFFFFLPTYHTTLFREMLKPLMVTKTFVNINILEFVTNKEFLATFKN